MSAWDKLLAASSLLAGTAWELISSPKTGGGSTVYVQQIQSVLADPVITASVADDIIRSHVTDGTITSIITVDDVETSLPDGTITGVIT